MEDVSHTVARSSRSQSQSSRTSRSVTAGRCSLRMTNLGVPLRVSFTARVVSTFAWRMVVRRWISLSSCLSFFLPSHTSVRIHTPCTYGTYLGR